ncbi:hypothetical protein Tco_1389691 [Tanacetum coccineum]
MDLKLEYQTFRAKTAKSLLQTYTRYKTLLNEISNDVVKLTKHEINVGFVNSLPKKWLSFFYGLRNANHTQTLDLADIYGVLDELMEITDSTELHKHMRFWFVQKIAEEEEFLKFLRDRCDDLRRKNARCRVLIGEMEASGAHGVAVDSLECLK